MKIKENRSVILYILFSILTCGIYGLYYIHALARDVNKLCEYDDKHTTGLFKMIVFCVFVLAAGFAAWQFLVLPRVELLEPIIQQAAMLAVCALVSLLMGLYFLVWECKIANRLRENAPRFGMTFKSGGGSIVAWSILGSLLFGIGPLVAFYLISNGTNRLARAYNEGNRDKAEY